LETELKRPSRRPVLIWLILSQALAVASLFFWLLMAGLSVMAFDSGVSAEAWTFVIAVWSYPLWPIAFAIGSWIAYARHKDRLAAVLTTLTFLPILLLLLVMLVGNFLFYLNYSPAF
jgi:glucan phosphoethanolaminetransferase (alkaline phosphatase superfamily)